MLATARSGPEHPPHRVLIEEVEVDVFDIHVMADAIEEIIHFTVERFGGRAPPPPSRLETVLIAEMIQAGCPPTNDP